MNDQEKKVMVEAILRASVEGNPLDGSKLSDEEKQELMDYFNNTYLPQHTQHPQHPQHPQQARVPYPIYIVQQDDQLLVSDIFKILFFPFIIIFALIFSD